MTVKYPIRDPFKYFFESRRFPLLHRYFLPDDFFSIDIDLVGTKYGEPKYLIESTTSVPQEKTAKNIITIANRLGCDAYVIQTPRMKRFPRSMSWEDAAQSVLDEGPPEFVTVRLVAPQVCDFGRQDMDGVREIFDMSRALKCRR